MSSQFNKSTSAYVPRVMCCKVCKDAGEPESVYSAHYVKDREGNVSCPKLKAIVCLNCNKRGHTSGYCKVPPSSTTDRTDKAISKSESDAKKAAAQKAPPTTGASRFACLLDSDSEDDELLKRKHSKPKTTSGQTHLPRAVQSPKSETVTQLFNLTIDFPETLKSTSNATPRVAETMAISYAGMASKPIPPKPLKQVVASYIPERVIRPTSPLTLPPLRIFKSAKDIDWTSMDSDSDDSDYENRLEDGCYGSHKETASYCETGNW